MKSKIILVALVGLCVVLAVCSCAAAAAGVPERSLESEQRIASMEINQSAGNMTGDDYLIALMYAYIDDYIVRYVTHTGESDSFNRLREEASSKFREYRSIYDDTRFTNKIDTMLTTANMPRDASGTLVSGSGTPAMPAQGWIDLFICELFYNDSELHVVYPHFGSSFGFSDAINKARTAYQTRISEEAEREAKQMKKATEQLREQQENAARQIALDAHYKNVFENYSTNVTNILNQSGFDDALNLSNETIVNLVSPYSNIVMIRKGDIYSQMTKYEEAIESYKRAQTDFTYSNESADFKESINKDFADNKWDQIAEMKIGMAQQNIKGQIHVKIHDLRDAPNVEKLLAGHDHGRQYTIGVENYTWEGGHGTDYVVSVIISSYNDPKSSDLTEYIKTNIPMCIDMFAALFSDKKVSAVHIQTNASYFDKFGHVQEKPIMIASLENATATQIGDWNAFKQYVGTDMSKFEQVIDLDLAY
jgi:tetratricopeptide (TPR) repeat protein